MVENKFVLIVLNIVFFKQELSKNPTLIGACLAYGDILNLEHTQEVASIFVHSCYGNHIVTENFKPLLEVCNFKPNIFW